MNMWRKRIITWSVILLAVIILWSSIGIGCNLNDDDGCFSITFDKFFMNTANRIVLRVGDKSYESTDTELVRKVTSETLLATNTHLCPGVGTHGWIDIYWGPIRVRSMCWTSEGIVVYEAGVLHWIFTGEDGIGLIHPSGELSRMLTDLMQPAQG